MEKIIHYCWFGGNEKSQIIKKCINSWKKYMPEYKIMEWNEKNIDLSFSPFVIEAYKNKKWAFVSDVIRLKVLYEYGGIYLDTDVELYESLDDLLKNNDAFFFFQNQYQINTGLGCGAKKENKLVKKMLDDYKILDFSMDFIDKIACPIRNTQVIKEYVSEFRNTGNTQRIMNISFISFDYYCQIAHHYGEFSWKDDEQKKALEYSKKNLKNWKIRKFLRSSKIFYFFEKYNMNRTKKIYCFFVYDLIDYGVKYWIYRLLMKFKKKRGI